MEAKPGSRLGGPPTPGPPAPAPEPGAGEAPAEHYGPLGVRRLRKDDGRHLTVYAHARPAHGDEGNETGPAPAL